MFSKDGFCQFRSFLSRRCMMKCFSWPVWFKLVIWCYTKGVKGIDSQLSPAVIELMGVQVGTRHPGSTAWSPLHRFWLLMTSPEQVGIARVRDVLASFFILWEEAETRRPSLFTSVLLTMSNLLANSESSSFRTISKKSKCLESQTTTRIVYLVHLHLSLMLSLCPEDAKYNRYTSSIALYLCWQYFIHSAPKSQISLFGVLLLQFHNILFYRESHDPGGLIDFSLHDWVFGICCKNNAV